MRVVISQIKPTSISIEPKTGPPVLAEPAGCEMPLKVRINPKIIAPTESKVCIFNRLLVSSVTTGGCFPVLCAAIGAPQFMQDGARLETEVPQSEHSISGM